MRADGRARGWLHPVCSVGGGGLREGWPWTVEYRAGRCAAEAHACSNRMPHGKWNRTCRARSRAHPPHARARAQVPKAPPHTLLLADAVFAPFAVMGGASSTEAVVAQFSGPALALRHEGQRAQQRFVQQASFWGPAPDHRHRGHPACLLIVLLTSCRRWVRAFLDPPCCDEPLLMAQQHPLTRARRPWAPRSTRCWTTRTSTTLRACCRATCGHPRQWAACSQPTLRGARRALTRSAPRPEARRARVQPRSMQVARGGGERLGRQRRG